MVVKRIINMLYLYGPSPVTHHFNILVIYPTHNKTLQLNEITMLNEFKSKQRRLYTKRDALQNHYREDMVMEDESKSLEIQDLCSYV